MPVTLDCPVRRVEWGADGVRVSTDQGNLRARATIVTVSNGVLADGGMVFAPELPTWKQRALEAVPMGRAEKIALSFDTDVFELPQNTLINIERFGCAVGFHLRPFGEPLAVAYTGGVLADRVAAMTVEEAKGFAMDYLAHAFGHGIRRHLRGTAVTAWGRDPWSRGSYSAARPGGHTHRAALARPLTPRLQFAGEATLTGAFATAHGAWMSGIRAAKAVVAALHPRCDRLTQHS